VRLIGLSGSLRARSYNTALLAAAAELVPPPARLERYAALPSVPPYSEDDEAEPVHRAVAALRDAVAASDGLVVATPEYNGSFPGALKNALDWLSRPFPANALRDKPVAVIGASTGAFGGIWAQDELRKVLRISGARVLDGGLAVPAAEDAFDRRLRLADRELLETLRALMEEIAGACSVASAPCPR
jgi:chromate reductase, NAD(P)H dehydrogenase (quinone)